MRTERLLMHGVVNCADEFVLVGSHASVREELRKLGWAA